MEQVIKRLASVAADYDAGRQGKLDTFTEYKDMAPRVLLAQGLKRYAPL